MAKAMPYTDSFGNENLNSYWRCAAINISITDNNAMVVIYGYKNAEARANNKQSIGSKSYSVSGETFINLLNSHLEPGGPNIMTLAYTIATQTLDVDAPTEEDPDRKVSFFEGAENV